MYKKIPEDVLNIDLQAFIDEYIEEDLSIVTLRLSAQSGGKFPLLAEQLKLYPKARKKLPTFASSWCFFTGKSYEQASSEELAIYKASLFKGDVMLDLTGGLGVDDWAFATRFKKVISIDSDAELNRIVRKNFEKLRINNVERIDAGAEEYTRLTQPVDLIYVDADRRPEHKNLRRFGLEASEPDVLAMKDRLFQLSETILLKLSPMLDIDEVIRQVNDVGEVWVVSLYNEVKELLVLLKKDALEPTIHAIDISGNHTQTYSGKRSNDVQVTFGHSGTYFYEPSLSLIKSGLAPRYCESMGLLMLAPHSYYFVADNRVKNFFGRSFKIADSVMFGKSAVKKYLSDNGITKANIARRNFPAEVNELKKMFEISDGGEDYLFFVQTAGKEKHMFHCHKL